MNEQPLVGKKEEQTEPVQEKPTGKNPAKEVSKWNSEEQDAIDDLQKQRFADRMTNKIPGEEVDALLKANGITPWTSEADKFMQRNDRAWAEEEFQKTKDRGSSETGAEMMDPKENAERKDGEKLFDRVLEVFSLMSGHQEKEGAKKGLLAMVGVIRGIDKEEKITKDNLGSAIEKMVDRLPAEHFPWIENFKGDKKESLKMFVKDLTEATKIDSEEERKKKLDEVMDKHKIEGELRGNISKLLEGAHRINKIIEKGQGGEKEKKELQETKGKIGGFMEKVWSTMGFIGGAILVALLMGVIVTLYMSESILKQSKR